jgi:hypothetical protein
MSIRNVFAQSNVWTLLISDINLPVQMLRQCVSDINVMERVN